MEQTKCQSQTGFPLSKARSGKTLMPELRLPPQDVVIVLGEPVGLFSHVYKQPQGTRPQRQPRRIALAEDKMLFFLLGQGQKRRRLDSLVAKRRLCRVELPFAAIDEQNVGKDNLVVGQ